jgi:pyridoxal phosphate enzyme (YggS family)
MVNASQDEILANFRRVLADLRQAAATARRSERSIGLVAVTKTQPVERIVPLLVTGHDRFGENRVQEAKAKWPALKAAYPAVHLHLIGPLQTNKVKDAVALFDVIETVDRPRLATALAEEMAASGRRPSCLIEINVGEEPQKAGVAWADADRFIEDCRGGLGLPIDGLMGIPPAGKDPLPYFLRLAKLATRHRLPALSMGMSGDFLVAIAAGASQVRVGTAIFGPRP